MILPTAVKSYADTTYTLIIDFRCGATKISGKSFYVIKTASLSSGGTYTGWSGVAALTSVDFNGIYTIPNETANILSQCIPENEYTKVVTDADGLATFDNLSEGLYLVCQKETAIQGDYAISPAFFVDLSRCNTDIPSTHSYRVYPKTTVIPHIGAATLRIIDHDSNKRLRGATFDLYKVVEDSNTSSSTSQNNSNSSQNGGPVQGRANILNTNSIVIFQNQVNTSDNTRYAVLGKRRAPSSDIFIGTFVSDEYGQLGKTDLEYGKYYFLQKSSPDNYQIDTTPHYFEVSEEEQSVLIEVTNKKIKQPATVVPKSPKADTMPASDDSPVSPAIATSSEDSDYTEPDLSTVDKALYSVATCNGQKIIPLDKKHDVKIDDVVYYKGYGKVGETYTMMGYIVNKSTGLPLVNEDGIPIIINKSFINDSQGQVSLLFEIAPKYLESMTEIVIYVSIVDKNGTVIATHTDINDVRSTLYIKQYDKVQTGIFPIFRWFLR